MSIPYLRHFDVPYGEVLKLSPLVSRLLAKNPSAFTFKGTGVYFIGDRDVAVIDPGPLLPGHLDVLKAASESRNITHILITHTHTDHSPAAALLKEWTGAKTYGFGPHGSGKAEDGILVEEGGDMAFVPDIAVKDGDRISGNGFDFECVFTPGHTSNHMCYALLNEQALFTGDHVMGWSTTVVAPPDGDMADYMASLCKLLLRDDKIMYPTHGAPISDVKPFLNAYLEHRLEREQQIITAIGQGLFTIPEMVSSIYAQVDPRLHPAASRSVLAHLIQLKEQGRLSENAGRYNLV